LNDIDRLSEAIKLSRRVCVFTGAGISCPSGIPDFRSAGGLYSQPGLEGYAPEQIISHDFFINNNNLFYKFYKAKLIFPEAKPNAAHKYFANLESLNKKVSVVTQNIDGLHQAAGSTEVFELHGSAARNYCLNCNKFYDLNYIINADNIPRCDCGGIIKPDVVLYSENLNPGIVNSAIKAISSADLLIIVGTSLTVNPAASYINYFQGDNMAIINKDKSARDFLAQTVIYGDVAEVVKEL